MRTRFPLTNVVQLALCACPLLLAGCPGSGDPGHGTLVAGVATLVEDIQYGSNTCAVPVNEATLVGRVLDLVNHEREQRVLHPLTLNLVLSKIAEDYCCEMIDGEFFAHKNPETDEGPGERAIKAGYVFLAIGENLAAGQSSPEQAVAEWMNSTLGHRENILSAQWREIGIGIRTGGEHGVYWVVEFGNPP